MNAMHAVAPFLCCFHEEPGWRMMPFRPPSATASACGMVSPLTGRGCIGVVLCLPRNRSAFLRPLDVLVIAAYFGATLAMGLSVRIRGRGNSDSFHLANRSLRWIAVGLSIMVTVFAAVNISGFSGEVATHGLYVLLVLPAFIFIIPPVWIFAIPAFRTLRGYSAYELLEHRHGPAVRRLAEYMFVVWRCAWLALSLHAMGIVMSRMTGLPPRALVIATAAVATAYTALGGMRSVIRTDMFQFAVMALGIAATLVVPLVLVEGGATTILRSAASAGLLRPFHPFDPAAFALDPTMRMGAWSCLIGGSVVFLARYGTDQSVVQRYLSAGSLADARRGFVLSVLVALLTILCLAGIGLIVAAAPSAAPGPPAARFADFALSLPRGFAGLLASAMLAATMSSVDSIIHSSVSVLTPESHGANRFHARVPRLLTLLLGTVTTVAACNAGVLGTVFEAANRMVNAFGSPLLALFVAGLLWRGVSGHALLWGGVAGALFSFTTGIFLENLALHYYAVVNLLGTLLLIFLAGVLFPTAGRLPEAEGNSTSGSSSP